ncbi:uncharacterized protein VP01_7602g1 [Puccinia sorghi]|uniref:Uncharacterized protein n=1 Tax=Puccinia sorghi TaxID=27349 RepID=A0A0L6UCT1_9BASI|nr:uncharacterized protein VP01_7602g1 [Puccinia sorghi]
MNCSPHRHHGTSARLAARTAKQTPAKAVEELVPALYHQYLRIFQKYALQGLPPRCQYKFRVELILGAVVQSV